MGGSDTDYEPNLTTGHGSIIKIGKANASKQCAQFGYHYEDDTTKAFALIGMHSADNLIKAYADKVDIRVPLNISNNNKKIYL